MRRNSKRDRRPQPAPDGNISGGRHGDGSVVDTVANISIRAPRGGRPISSRQSTSFRRFQFAPPRGGRQQNCTKTTCCVYAKQEKPKSGSPFFWCGQGAKGMRSAQIHENRAKKALGVCADRPGFSVLRRLAQRVTAAKALRSAQALPVPWCRYDAGNCCQDGRTARSPVRHRS